MLHSNSKNVKIVSYQLTLHHVNNHVVVASFRDPLYSFTALNVSNPFKHRRNRESISLKPAGLVATTKDYHSIATATKMPTLKASTQSVRFTATQHMPLMDNRIEGPNFSYSTMHTLSVDLQAILLAQR